MKNIDEGGHQLLAGQEFPHLIDLADFIRELASLVAFSKKSIGKAPAAGRKSAGSGQRIQFRRQDHGRAICGPRSAPSRKPKAMISTTTIKSASVLVL